LLAGAVVMALACFRLPERARLPAVRLRSLAFVAAALIIVTFAGHYWVLSSYDMSRDEQMASFDAAVFAQGHLAQHLPALWRDHSDALNTLFMIPVPHRGAWISSYLPLNAGIRALLGTVATPGLAGPLMTALGALALWGCVRRLWPDDHEAGFVALVLYAGSAQVLVMGMTSYAMPGHLALNLCWLWLFLRQSRVSDLAALMVGFVATGLHQPLMHQMFATPFLFLLILDRRWDRAVLYFIGYAVIGAFWLWWPHYIGPLLQAGSRAAEPQGNDFITRMVAALRDRDTMGLPDMVANLLRFIAWQHLLLVPLLLIGARLGRKERMAGAMVGGLVLTTLVMGAALPYQGHGFGYRYLHGLIGNAILLAIYGWKALGEERAQWRALLIRTTAATLIVIMPLQLWMAHAFYAPAAQVSGRIGSIAADYAVIGGADAPYANDLVFNPPKLDRRPVRLLRGELDDGAVATICAGHPSVALIGNGMLAPIATYYGFGHAVADEPNAVIAPRLARAGCVVRRVG
jgi:hypothetical protein